MKTGKIKEYFNNIACGKLLRGINQSTGFKFIIYLFYTTVAILFLACFFLYIIPTAQEFYVNFKLVNVKVNYTWAEQKIIEKSKEKTRKNITRITNKLESLTPRTTYLVVNTSGNEFYLYSRLKLIRSGICSTGSYTLLKSGDQQEWIFKTPRGLFHIHGKTTSPVWKKPDWAFIEEGLPVPPPDHHTRFEYGTLGDYALSMGRGYLIHGTLYKRFLGLAVTHGCIRMNDEDLKVIYYKMDIGSKVFIY